MSPLSYTHDAFVEAIHAIIGKGRQHAGIVYEEFFRRGLITGQHPAFNNAQALLKEIIALLDQSVLTISLNKSDGITSKFLLKTHDNLEIESVLIPMQSGGTLCVSSQVGCRMGCAFCETGRMGLLRNLTVEEIVSQIFVARHQLKLPFRNVVFMGMGEPFDNYAAVMQAARVLQDSKGFGFGRKNITVSTSGLISGIDQLVLAKEHAPNLAVSITAPNDALRNRLMPVNRKHNLAELHAAMQRYCSATGREILIAYVLMKEQNDSLEHAEQLAEYLKGLQVKINLIPYNPQSRDRFQPSDSEVLNQFASHLRLRGYYTLLRVTKGSQIMAACGQLGNVDLRKKLRQYKRAPEGVL